MHCLMTGIRSEKRIVRLFHCCVNVTEWTYTNLDGITCRTPRIYTAYHSLYVVLCLTKMLLCGTWMYIENEKEIVSCFKATGKDAQSKRIMARDMNRKFPEDGYNTWEKTITITSLRPCYSPHFPHPSSATLASLLFLKDARWYFAHGLWT